MEICLLIDSLHRPKGGRKYWGYSPVQAAITSFVFLSCSSASHSDSPSQIHVGIGVISQDMTRGVHFFHSLLLPGDLLSQLKKGSPDIFRLQHCQKFLRIHRVRPVVVGQRDLFYRRILLLPLNLRLPPGLIIPGKQQRDRHIPARSALPTAHRDTLPAACENDGKNEHSQQDRRREDCRQSDSGSPPGVMEVIFFIRIFSHSHTASVCSRRENVPVHSHSQKPEPGFLKGRVQPQYSDNTSRIFASDA